VLGRYRYHTEIIDLGSFQVNISSQNHEYEYMWVSRFKYRD
jgi:hypothetical protein